MAIRILIADDHRLFRAGLRTLLGGDPNFIVVGEATDGDETLRAAQELHPDVVLLDINMPGPPWLETLSRLRQSVPDTRVLVLTMYEDRALVQEFLRAGASGYITKRAAETELVDAIYAVWRGIIYLHPAMLQSLVLQPKESPPLSLSPNTLTSREVDVLRLIAQGNTNRQIAESLSISVRTVETHRSNLMDKLDLHSRVDLVRYAVERGIASLEDED